MAVVGTTCACGNVAAIEEDREHTSIASGCAGDDKPSAASERCERRNVASRIVCEPRGMGCSIASVEMKNRALVHVAHSHGRDRSLLVVVVLRDGWLAPWCGGFSRGMPVEIGALDARDNAEQPVTIARDSIDVHVRLRIGKECARLDEALNDRGGVTRAARTDDMLERLRRRGVRFVARIWHRTWQLVWRRARHQRRAVSGGA